MSPTVQAKSQSFSSLYHKLNGRARAAELIELAMHPVGYVELLSVDQAPHYEVYVIFGAVGMAFFWAFRLCCRRKQPKVVPEGNFGQPKSKTQKVD